jgi:hypothetical protein
MLSSDFFRGTDGFFRRSARLFPKKSPFSSKKPSKTFSEVPMDFGTFSERAMNFSAGEFGSFGGFVLILFRVSDGNPTNCDFHRLLGKEALSIACPEKVRGKGQHLRLFHRILQTLPRKNPTLPRKKSGNSGAIF